MYYCLVSFYKVFGAFILALSISFSCEASFRLQHLNWVKLSIQSSYGPDPLPWMQVILKQQDAKFDQDISTGAHVILTIQNYFQGSKMGAIQAAVSDDINRRAFRTYRSFDIAFQDNQMKTFNLSIKRNNVTWYLARNKNASSSFSPSQSFTLQKDSKSAVLFTVNDVFSTKKCVESIVGGSGYLNMRYSGQNYASAIVEEGSLNFVRALQEGNGQIRFVKKVFDDQGTLVRSEDRMPDELDFRMIPSKGFFFIKSRDGKFLQAKQEGKTVGFGEKKSEKWQASWWELVPVDEVRRENSSNSSNTQRTVYIRNVLTSKFLDGVVGSQAIISKTTAGVFMLSDNRPEGDILRGDRDKRIYQSGRRELFDEDSNSEPAILLGKDEKISFGDYILPSSTGSTRIFLPFFVVHGVQKNKKDGLVGNGSAVKLSSLEYSGLETPFEVALDHNKGQKSFLTYREFIFNIENGKGENKDKFVFTLSVKHGGKIWYVAYKSFKNDNPLLYDVSDFSDMFYLTVQKDKALKFGIKKHISLDESIDEIVKAQYLFIKGSGRGVSHNKKERGFAGGDEWGIAMSDDVSAWKALTFKRFNGDPRAITIQDKNNHFLQFITKKVVDRGGGMITYQVPVLAPIDDNNFEKAYWYLVPWSLMGDGMRLYNKGANKMLSIDRYNDFYFTEKKPE